jgi:hypothetical protein
MFLARSWVVRQSKAYCVRPSFAHSADTGTQKGVGGSCGHVSVYCWRRAVNVDAWNSRFMKPGVSLPYQKQPALDPHPESGESIAHVPTLFVKQDVLSLFWKYKSRFMKSPCCLSVFVFACVYPSVCVSPQFLSGGLWDHLAVCLSVYPPVSASQRIPPPPLIF